MATGSGKNGRENNGLTARQRVVWDRLNAFHQGRHRGIANQELARVCRMSERRLREAIAVLVVDHGRSIGTHPDYGVYVCQDARDYEIAARCLHDHIWPALRRQRALERLQRAHERRCRLAARQEAVQGSLFGT